MDRGLKRAAVVGVVAAMVLGGVGVGGCGPKRRPPKEVDVSRLPGPVLEQFRRDRPNSVIVGVSGPRKGEWEINHFTPRAERKTSYYSSEGDKVGGW